MANNNRTAVYLRVAQRDDYSIAAQRVQVLRFADAQGHADATVYCDNGASGSNFDREAFMRMDADIRAGKFDAIFVQSFSRIGRNVFDVISWLDDMKEIGVTVKALDGSIDSYFDKSLHDIVLDETIIESLRKSKSKGGKHHGA